jgi:MSHA biogenesis protein MshJ
MKRYWDLACGKIDSMSLRERVMIFAAAAFVVVALINSMLLNPLLAKQKTLSLQVVQQQEKMKELQGQTQALLQARRDDEHSPLRQRVLQLQAQLQEQDAYMQSRRDRLVKPDKMAELLEQVLNRNGQLQLVELKTLPVDFLIPQAADTKAGAKSGDGQRQIFKHGVQISVRGGYLDMLRYLDALEKMPTQMFWGEVSLDVDQYPEAVLTLTLYTLSLDKTWLTV